jgi:hypothetical protein
MLTATAAASARIRIPVDIRGLTPEESGDHKEECGNRFAHNTTKLSENGLILGPSRVSARWLRAVQQRLFRSLVPKPEKEANDGRWLTEEIVDASNLFFETTSDVLPGEPFIYSSQKGDLVAEFDAQHGTLTGIVTPTTVILFAIAKGLPTEKVLPISLSSAAMRQEVRQLTELVGTELHGAVDTKK